jgi:protein TonB
MTATVSPDRPQPFGPGVTPGNGPMLLAVAIAVLLHLLLLLGVGFKMPEPRERPPGSIELLIVQQTGSGQMPPTPESVPAQADRAGETMVPLPELDEPQPAAVSDGADSVDDSDQMKPEPPMAELLPAPEPASEPTPEPEQAPEPEQPLLEPEPERPELLTTEQPAASTKDIAPKVSAADILASRSAEIERLTARIDAETSAYASRARRKAISTSTREYRYATYMEAWRRKVERIGNLNYPEEAKRLGLYGSLILHVAVRADGSLDSVRVVRSSGQQVLDQAAVRIVELAAPYAPFPPDISAETDILDITRTWQFQRNNQLGWDN